jgi:hypothetical protein
VNWELSASLQRSVTRYLMVLMVEPKYRLPIWLQTIWAVVCAPLLFVGFAPSFDRLIAGPAIVALATVFAFTCFYNKAKTGMWLPGARKRASREGRRPSK